MKEVATMCKVLNEIRETMTTYGSEYASSRDLLAVALGISPSILEGHTTMEVLDNPQDIAGLGAARVASINAIKELALRLARKKGAEVKVIHGPDDVAHYAMPYSLRENREHFWVLLLNTKNHIISMQEVSVGSLTASVVHPREVFETAVKHHAASIILLHNHPSGDPTPSREDIAVTERLVKAGKVMDIPVLDHVILGNNRFASLKERGLLE
jgi:DNA repair protein RadC